MQINIGTKTVEESNEFLRSLWAEMEKEFGTCDWTHFPVKKGAEQMVYFGNVRISEFIEIAVSISYKKRGSINNLYFDSTSTLSEIEKGNELYATLTKIVKAANKNLRKYQEHDFSILIRSFHPLPPYKGNNFEIKLISYEGTSQEAGFQVECKVKTYNRRQAYRYTDKLLGKLMDFLSVETDDIFWADGKEIDYDELTFPEKFLERRFMDPNELYWDFRLISKEGKQFLDILTDYNKTDDPDLNSFMKACNHFHTARKQEEQTIKGYKSEDIKKIGTSQAELATTLYLSALEVVSLIGFEEEKCKDCGQPKYEISSRINNMVSKYIPGELGNEFKTFYEQRSDYLHQGKKIRTNMPLEFYYPQLDLNEDNLCEIPDSIHLHFLRECVGYCLRSFYKEKFLK